MRTRKTGRTGRHLIVLALLFIAGVATVLAIVVLGSRRDTAAVLEARARSAESVAQYQRQFAPKSEAPPAPKTTSTEIQGDTRPKTSFSAPELFKRLTPVITVLRRQPDYMAAEDIVKGRGPREWTDDDLRVLTALFSKHADVLDAIRTIAERGEALYRVDLSQGLPVELPHLAQLRDMAELLEMEAGVRARQGDTENALNNYRAIIALGETLVDEPILNSQLVRIALWGTVYDGIDTALEPGQLTPEQARDVVRDAASLYHREAFANALAAETAFGLQVIDEAAESGDVPFTLGAINDPAVDVLAGYLYQSPVGGVLLSGDKQTYSEYMNRIVRAAGQPYYQVEDELEAIEAELGDLSFLDLYSRNLIPPLTRAQLAQARAEAKLDLLRIGLSLDVYYDEHGAYPHSLDAVAADLGGEVPVDPFTGQAYVYIP
ncbi:MAG: hypothetical protein U9Q79_05130, partial [Candidatus Hydrogenedentes bacterium]|nr:hypothetical protein [Candidatus Hydrogenedentota bacterium]